MFTSVQKSKIYSRSIADDGSGDDGTDSSSTDDSSTDDSSTDDSSTAAAQDNSDNMGTDVTSDLTALLGAAPSIISAVGNATAQNNAGIVKTTTMGQIAGSNAAAAGATAMSKQTEVLYLAGGAVAIVLIISIFAFGKK